MIKLTLLSICAVSLIALVDLGENGKATEIKEKDLYESFNEKKANMDTSGLKKKIDASVTKLATVSSSLIGCMQTKEYTVDNLQPSKVTYYDLDGKPYIDKEDEIPVYYPIKASVCIINGSSTEIAEQSMYKLLKHGRCDKVMAANRDFRELKYIDDKAKFYPFNVQLAEIVKARCLPMRAEMHKDKIRINEDYIVPRKLK